MEDDPSQVAHYCTLNSLLCDGFRTLLPEDPYYAARGKANKAFANAELETLQYAIKTFDKSAAIIEAGCGAGQMCLLLVAAGFTCMTGFEMMQSRYDAAKTLAGRVAYNAHWPSAVEPLLINEKYPRSMESSYDLLITMNVVNSEWDDQPEPYAALRGVQHAIVDARLWGIVREDSGDQALLINDMLAQTEMRRAQRISMHSTIWHLSRS